MSEVRLPVRLMRDAVADLRTASDAVEDLDPQTIQSADLGADVVGEAAGRLAGGWVRHRQQLTSDLGVLSAFCEAAAAAAEALDGQVVGGGG